nr:hypothetical protein [uncultured Campylobacter sp.]
MHERNLVRGQHFGDCGRNLDSRAHRPTKFYATPCETLIRRESDEILKARFEMEFRWCLLGRAGR